MTGSCLNRILACGIAVLCLGAPVGAHAENTAMGSVTLKLDVPAGYCALDTRQKADKRVFDVVSGSLARTGNDLLGMSADCKELTTFRGSKNYYLQHYAQYQTQASQRAQSFGIEAAQDACKDLRTRGEQLAKDVVASANEAIHKAISTIDVQQQTFLGIVGDDPAGCYAGLFQTIKAEDGSIKRQVCVFFIGSIRDRELFVYFFAPYENDASLPALTKVSQDHLSKVKAANGL
jgi:hypothetical protein